MFGLGTHLLRMDTQGLRLGTHSYALDVHVLLLGVHEYALGSHVQIVYAQVHGWKATRLLCAPITATCGPPKKSATFTHWKSTPVHQVPRTPTTAHERVLCGATCVMCKPTCFACVPICAQRVVWRRVFLRVYAHLRNYVRPRNRATKNPLPKGERTFGARC